MLLVTGGVSAGKFDLVEPALARLGARFHFTGVRIQPGKPLVFGEVPATDLQNQSSSGHPSVLRAAREPDLFGGDFSVVWLADPGRPCRQRQSGPRFALARLAKEIKASPT